MEWSIALRILLPFCYFILIIAILRNIAILTITDCPPATIIAKSLFDDPNHFYNFEVESQKSEFLSKQFRKLQKLPECIIIGVRKGGTRALLDAIALHPQIKIVRREVHFFDNNETYERGLSWYRSQMPFTSSSQIAIEKTPAYFTNELTPGRVYNMNPNLKFILIIRDPVLRAISDYTQVMCTRMEQNKSQIVFEKVAFLNDGVTINTDYKPIRNSLYSIHMRRWLKYFPLKNILILDGDKFARRPLPELRRVEHFLHLPRTISSDQLVYDENKHFYCFRRKNRLKAKCLGNSKGRPHATIAENTKNILRESFAVYNEEFFKIVNRRWYW